METHGAKPEHNSTDFGRLDWKRCGFYNLVGGIPTPLKYYIVSWGYYTIIPNMMGKIKNVPNHQPELLSWPLSSFKITQIHLTRHDLPVKGPAVYRMLENLLDLLDLVSTKSNMFPQPLVLHHVDHLGPRIEGWATWQVGSQETWEPVPNNWSPKRIFEAKTAATGNANFMLRRKFFWPADCWLFGWSPMVFLNFQTNHHY